MALLLLSVVLAVVVSSACSLMETVLRGVTPAYVAWLERERHPAAARLKRLRRGAAGPVVAVMSLNALVRAGGAAGVGLQAMRLWGSPAAGFVAAGLALVVVVAAEVVPKAVGAAQGRALAPFVAPLVGPVTRVMAPFTWLYAALARQAAPEEKPVTVSRDELAALAERAEREGVFEAAEARILQSLLRFGSLRVQDVMTPRTVLFALPEAMRPADLVGEHAELRFSRIPVYGESRDDITGYVLKDDLLLRAARADGQVPLGSLRRPIEAVPATLLLPELFERLLDAHEHIALAVDEYGDVEGIVTMEDVIESLLGREIVDEADAVTDLQALARRKWLRRASRLGLLPEPGPPRPVPPPGAGGPP